MRSDQLMSLFASILSLVGSVLPILWLLLRRFKIKRDEDLTPDQVTALTRHSNVMGWAFIINLILLWIGYFIAQALPTAKETITSIARVLAIVSVMGVLIYLGASAIRYQISIFNRSRTSSEFMKGTGAVQFGIFMIVAVMLALYVIWQTNKGH